MGDVAFHLCCALALAVSACGSSGASDAGDADAGGRQDAGSGMDAGRGIDAGAGMDSAVGRDAGPADAGIAAPSPRTDCPAPSPWEPAPAACGLVPTGIVRATAAPGRGDGTDREVIVVMDGTSGAPILQVDELPCTFIYAGDGPACDNGYDGYDCCGCGFILVGNDTSAAIYGNLTMSTEECQARFGDNWFTLRGPPPPPRRDAGTGDPCRDCLDTCLELHLPSCCTGCGCICQEDCGGSC